MPQLRRLLPAVFSFVFLACTPPIQEIAFAPETWAGVAVSPDDRIFVSFPRALNSANVMQSVAEVVHQPSGPAAMVPYPPATEDDLGFRVDWNAWDPAIARLLGAPYNERHFISVQSVVFDGEGFLWALDSGGPSAANPLAPGGPKLVRIDPERNLVVRVVPLGAVAPAGAFLNDARIDLRCGCAYITESGLGAIVVVNLENDTAWRVLENHPATSPEGFFLLFIEDVIIDAAGDRDEQVILFPLQIAADGIALDPGGGLLYFQAVSGTTLYRVRTEALFPGPGGAPPMPQVERVGGRAEGFGPADGLGFGPDGWLYLTSLEDHAIKRWHPESGVLELVSDDPRLAWPDSLAFDPDGAVVVTVSQLHRKFLAPERLDPQGFGLLRLRTSPAATGGAE
jgi:sugar lactone lactonase YvrE